MRVRDAIVKAERFFERLLGAYENAPPITADERLAELAQKYNLQIITDYEAVEENFSFSALNKAQLKKAGDLLVSELTLYSPEAIRASKLERLVLCSDLRGAEETVAGLADIGFLVVDTIFVNIDRAARIWEHARRTVHHELFHCMDYHDDGYIDFEWRKLNTPDFTYWHLNNLTVCESHEEGFLQDYCKSSEWEDKAVVFSYMMVNYSELLDRCERDEILGQKVERIKELLLKISPEFDADFWKRVHRRSLGDNPFEHPIAQISSHQHAERGEQEDRVQQRNQGDQRDPPDRITITYDTNGKRPTWLVSVETRDSLSQRFYSYNKLCQFLIKNGVRTVPSKEDVTSGVYTVEQ